MARVSLRSTGLHPAHGTAEAGGAASAPKGRRRWPGAIGWVLGAVVVGLCSVPAVAGASPRSAGADTVVTAAVRSLGTVIATPKHFVLYEFAGDGPDVSTCTGACAKTWPPYLLASGQRTVHAPKGVHGLGTITRGRRLQVTFDGHPLYRFSGDRRAAVAHGEGVEDQWFAVDLAGQEVEPPGTHEATSPANTSSPSSTTVVKTPTTQPTAAATTPTTRPTTGGTTPPTAPPPTTQPTTAVTTPPTTSATTVPTTSPPTTSPPAPTTTPTTAPPSTTTTTSGGGGYGY